MDHRPNRPHAFASTRWSLVAGGAEGGEQGRRALGELCEIYWFPLYAYVRRQGVAAGDAEDLVQGFLGLLIERNDLATLDASRGRFRAFLIAALRNFVNNERDRERATKRGGDRELISMDADDGERRYLAECSAADTPERAYERGFALELIARCMHELGDDWRRAGREDDYAKLSTLLTPGGDATYREVGESLAMSESAVKMAVHRLRRRMSELLRAEIRDVVLEDEDVEVEIQHLFVVLGSSGQGFSARTE